MRLGFIFINLFILFVQVISLTFKEFLCDNFKICQREPTIYEICDLFNLKNDFCIYIRIHFPNTDPETKY